MIISLIAAVAENRVIGKDNDLIWRLPRDTRFFMETTKGHHILTGRKNYESIPEKYRPLKNRTNIVVTNQRSYQAPGAKVVFDLEEGIEFARKHGETELFVIGGGKIYYQALPKANRLYITEVKAEFEGDTYFPEIDPNEWRDISRVANFPDHEHPCGFDFVVKVRKDG